jgi:hypothetical protein
MSEISVSVVGSTTINPTVGNGSIVNVTFSETGARGPKGDTGPAGPANVLSIGTVSQGAAAATLTGAAPNQVLNLVLQKGDAGTNVELQATSTHIQWRLVGSSTWTNLVALTAITGPTGSTGAAGAAVELQATSTHLQWRYVGGSTWTNVFELSSLVGATGPQGPAGPAGPPVNLADETPQPLGVASAGTALAAARADHVHSQGSIAYSALSGIPSTFAPAAHQHAISDVTGLQTALDGKQASGTYATLVNGQVPSAQLPSFVDDVLEYANLAGFPATGEVGKIFVARDTNKAYRWSGSAYVEISASPGSTDAVPEGSANLYHTTGRAAAAAPVQSVAGRTGAITLTYSDLGGTPPAATTKSLGAVIVGSGLTITDGVLAATGGGSGLALAEHATTAQFPATGVAGTLYCATDAGRLYRWTGSVYAELGSVGGEDTTLRALFVPPAPTGVTATAGNAQATVSWTAWDALSTLPITDYTVQFSTNSGSTWTTFARSASTATSATVTGLTNGTAVVFRVSATNGVGTGSYSTASSAVTPAAAPTGVTVLSGSASGSGTNTITATAQGNISLSVPATRTLSWTGGAGQFITGPQQAGFDFDGDVGWYRNMPSSGGSFAVIAGTYRTENTQNGATLTFTP